MYTLILAEKPSAARNFAKALGGREGTFEGTQYCICSLRGHVMGISTDFSDQVADDLVKQYKSWDVTLLPWNRSDIAFKRVPNPTAKNVLAGLSDALKGASEVCIATDVDPSGEGELLAWEALDYCGWHGRTTRMYHEDEEVPSVRKAFVSRKELPSMNEDSDYKRAWVRDRWDWLSMQWTRAATDIGQQCGLNRDALLREGRLKSVIVDLVAKQQAAYKNYKRVPFYENRFKSNTGVIFSVDPENAKRFTNKDAAQITMPQTTTSTITVDSKAKRHQAPPRLPDLSDLAARLAPRGISPKQVLNIYQAMYEDQVVSYPRTEDKFISPEQYNDMLKYTDAIAQVVGVDPSLLTHSEPRKTHVKSGGAHGANRPGSHVPDRLEDLDKKYGQGASDIYRELALAWLAILAEDRDYDHYEGHVDDHPLYKGTCDVTTAPGWTAIVKPDSDKDDDEENNAEASGLGTTCEAFVFEGKNKRPQRPSMKWIKSKLDKYDVGTAATRTSTLVEVSNGKAPQLRESKGILTLTDLGVAGSTLMNGCLIADPSVTESLYKAMADVGSGDRDADDVLNEVAGMVTKDINTMLANKHNLMNLIEQGIIKTASGELICPRCGKPLVSNKAKTMYYCSSRKVHKGEGGRWYIDNPGCGFKLGATVYGQKLLLANDIKHLLQGKSVLIHDLKSKKGNNYSVRVYLDKNSEWGTRIEFDDSDSKWRKKKTTKKTKGRTKR